MLESAPDTPILEGETWLDGFLLQKRERGRGEGEGEGEGERETEKVQNKKLPWSSVSHC